MKIIKFKLHCFTFLLLKILKNIHMIYEICYSKFDSNKLYSEGNTFSLFSP